MEAVLTVICHRATKNNVRILAVIWAILAFGVMPMAESEIKRISEGAVHILDLSVGYSPAEAYTNFTNLGSAGRQMYLFVEVTADVVYPLATAILFALLLARLQSLTGAMPYKKLPFLPFFTLFFDYLENMGLVTALLSFPQNLPLVIEISSVMTLLKWAFAAVNLLIVLVLIFHFFTKK